MKDVDVIPSFPSVHGLQQSNPLLRRIQCRRKELWQEGWDQRGRQPGVANGSEGVQNALASMLRAAREEAGAETAAGAEGREGRAGESWTNSGKNWKKTRASASGKVLMKR